MGESLLPRGDPARTSLQPAAWHRMVVMNAQPLGRGVMPPVDLPDGHLSAQFSTVPAPTSVLVHRPVSSIATRMRLASHDTCARSHGAGASPGNASGSPIARYRATVSTACATLPLAEEEVVFKLVFNPVPNSGEPCLYTQWQFTASHPHTPFQRRSVIGPRSCDGRMEDAACRLRAEQWP